jgi:Phage tail fibre repeat
MPFSKPLPEWNNLGTKPPQSKIDTGWLPDDRPPADWWNWFQYTTHQALLEVQQNAVHTDRAGQTIAQLVSGKVPVAQLPDGTTSAKGILQLTSATNSTSTGLAATASAVKTAYDLANGKYTKPALGIPKSDLDTSVQASLGNADTAEANAIAHADEAVSNVQTDLNNHKGSGGTAHANATQIASGFQSASDKTKLDGIATGAEVNQNTFANVKVGTTTIASDSKTDTLELAAGTNVVLTPDATNDKVTIALSAEVETVTGSQAKATAVQNNLNTHTADTSNPHAVTAAQVGAYSKTEADANYAPKSHVGASGAAHPAATTAAAGFMSTADKSKLDGIAAGANNYSHPANHPPSIITQDANNRFVTDTEKANWNGKASTAVATTTANGLMAAADKSKLDGISPSADVNQNAFSNVVVGATTIAADTQTDTLTLAATAPITITPDATNDKVTFDISNATTAADGAMSAADKTKLDGIAPSANNYVHPTTTGNKHIPAGGAANQFLEWSADGTAVWSTIAGSQIVEDASNRLVTDTEKADWNAKLEDDSASRLSFLVEMVTAQSIGAAVMTKVAYKGAASGRGTAQWSTTSYRFTAPKTGVYSIGCCVRFDLSQYTAGELYLYKNGVNLLTLGKVVSPGSANLGITGAANIALAAGDYIEIFGFSSIASSYSTDSYLTVSQITP